MNKAKVLIIFVAILLSGCASNKVTESVVAFGKQTEKATTAYSNILSSYYKNRSDKVKQDTIERRVDFLLSVECSTAIFDDSVNPASCDFKSVTPSPNLVTELKSDQLKLLAKALSEYASSLALLAGDFSEGDTALLNSLTETGAAIINLDKAVSGLNNSESSLAEEELNTVTNVVAKVTSAGLKFQREKALLELIEESDVLVQSATATLSASMQDLRSVIVADSAQELNKALRNYSKQIKTRAKLEKPYKQVEEAIETHRANLALQDPFAKIGEVHAELREAAAKGLTLKELRALIAKIIDVANSIKA